MSYINTPFKNTIQAQNQLQNESPNRQKIMQLSEKWSTISQILDKDKQDRKNIVEERIIQLEDRINMERPNDEAGFQILKEQVLKLQQALEDLKQGREQIEDQKSKEIKYLQESLNTALDEEKQVQIYFLNYKNKRVVDSNVLKQTEDRFHNLNVNLQKTNIQYQGNLEQSIREVDMVIEGVQQQVEHETRKREESTQLLTEEIESELNRFHDVLLVEKKVREETQNKIFRMIEDIHSKLQHDIQVERKEREQTNDALVRLLEDTCNKIDSNFAE